MKLLTFLQEGKSFLGVKTDQGVVHISKALAKYEANDEVPHNVMDVINGGNGAVAALQAFVDKVLGSANSSDVVLDESALSFGPCVTEPNKIICVGLNYQKHAEETNSPIPQYPILFNKFNNTLTGHKHDIAIPKVTKEVDYEVELAIVIGKKAKYVDKEHALDYVFGYSTVNDISARDLQMRTKQWLLGKSCDDFSPLGPYLVSGDEVGDPNQLKLSCTVNGEVRQDSNTADMIFPCNELVSYISHHMTLVPGDIILTGTPSGVVLGKPVNERVYLRAGDVVTAEVEKLGALTNRFIKEEA